MGQTLNVDADGGVLSNDTNADGLPLTAQLDTSPVNGTVTLNPDGSFTYTPNTGFCGTDSFSYVATDGMATSTPATVTITVYSQPVANMDTYITEIGQPLIVSAADGVLANDTDADGETLTARLVVPPSNGTLVFNADGSFTYTPNPGFIGYDGFVYIASDSYSSSGAGEVNIHVIPPPVANPDSYATLPGQTLYVNALGSGHVAIFSDTNDDAAQLANALFAAVPDVQVHFEGDASDLNADMLNDFASSAASMNMTTIVVWQLPVSPDLLALAQMLGLQIFVSNDMSVLVNDVQLSTHYVPGGVLYNDNEFAELPLTAILDSTTSHGCLTLNPDGSFSYTPDNGFTGTDTFTYSATDGYGTSAPTTVTITVYSIPVANPDQYSTPSGQTLTVSAWGNGRLVAISDTNADDTTLKNALLASVPNIQIPFMGLASALTAANLNNLVGADAAMDIKTIVVWRVTVSPTLLALAQSLGLQIFVSNKLVTLESDVKQATLNMPGGVLDNDTNADGNPLSAQLVTTTGNGSLTLNADGSFSYTPNAGFIGTDSFTYTATDGYTTSLPATVTINVTYPVPTITSFTPPGGVTGTPVTVTGTGFTWATEVDLGDTSEPFQVIDDNTIILTVTSDATTGQITVTTPGGSATSDDFFIVYQNPDHYLVYPEPGRGGDGGDPLRHQFQRRHGGDLRRHAGGIVYRSG